MDFAAMFIKLITKNGLVAAFIIIGITTWIAYKIGGLTKGRIYPWLRNCDLLRSDSGIYRWCSRRRS